MKRFIVLFFFFFIVSSPYLQVYAEGTYANLGTSDASDGSQDAINFSQGRVWTIDKYGKYIVLTQNRTGPTSHWTWSNNAGTSWTQGSESYSFLTRGSVAYDSINDKLHVIWSATDSADGIIYRRYGITRDASNNITAISREDSSNINLQLDTSTSRTLAQPVALWVNDGSANGSLIAIWSKSGTSMSEIRGSMRKLSLSASDGSAGNWKALDGTADSFSTDAPAVEADKIYASAINGIIVPSAIIRGGTGSRKNDLYIFVAEAVGSNFRILSYRGIWNTASTNWSNGWQAPVTVGSGDNSNGYNLKPQLITKPVLDTANDRLYIGWARWKDNTAGDTVSIAYLDATDTVASTTDIYSANGTHSYAPTLDIAYDSSLNLLYIAYIESTTNGSNGSVDYKTFNGTSLSSSTTFYTNSTGSAGANGSADIPILYESRSANNRLLFAFRINGALPPTAQNPHTIDWGYITLPTPTPTPTPTSTPTPTATVAQTISSTTSTAPPSCTQPRPIGKPDLFQADTKTNQIQLYFSPLTSPLSQYVIAYGYSENDERFNISLKGNSTGVLSYTLSSLSPATKYFIKVRGDNGCTPGEWGNTLQVTTAPKGATTGKKYYKNFIAQIVSFLPRQTTQLLKVSKPTTTACTSTYSVQAGDSLWSIAQQLLDQGSFYQQILQVNSEITNPNALRIGQALHIPCKK